MYNLENVGKYKNEFIKLYFKDSLEGNHVIAGVIKEVNKTQIVFYMNNEEESTMNLNYSQLQHIELL